MFQAQRKKTNNVLYSGMSSRTSAKLLNEWLVDYSIELNPASLKKLPNLNTLFPSTCKIFIPSLPGKDFSEVCEGVSRVKSDGLIPIPHIVARNIKNKAQLKQHLDKLQEFNIDELLLLGGGTEQVSGEFECVTDMLETRIFEEYSFSKYNIAGHPEKHPFATDQQLLDAYKAKYEYLNSRNKDLCVITQFSFLSDCYINFAKKFIELGIPIPIKAGLPGKTELLTLIKYSVLCGVGNSLKVLKKDTSNLLKLTAGFSPENIFIPLADKVIEQGIENLTGLHFFSFGNVKKTSELLKKISLSHSVTSV